MSILDDVGTKLTTDSIVEGASGWTLAKSWLPPSPDKVIVIFETGGAVPDQTDGTKYTFPTFQVRGRGEEFGYEALRVKMQEVFDSLNDSDISGYVYIFAETSGPIPLRFDKQDNRPEMVWNFKAMKI